jgi:HlyD family secretion protein
MARILGWIFALLVIAAVAYGGYIAFDRFTAEPTYTFRTAPVKRGELVSAISATGTVEPEEVIDVGAQVAGQILSFGKDASGKPIDYGSQVEENMVLAQIDDVLYKAEVDTQKAAVASANASVARATADLQQLKAKFEQASRDWERAQRLGPSDALAQTSFDAYRAGFETTRANIAVGEATIKQAQARLAQAQAALDRAQRNLGYTVIKSPVRGVIIDRRVNIGQTVVASLNAPSLFLIAKDLRRMQVWVAVNEADIGNIHPGQPVTFTVDSFPGVTFKGEVLKVRLNATMTQNVVTYTVEVLTDNSSGKLLPYLTANVQFEVARHDNVLTVPNAALRWLPQTSQIAPEFRNQSASGKGGGKRSGGGGGKGEGGGKGGGKGGDEDRDGRGRVWVRDGQYVKPVSVRTGITDGLNTEIKGGEINENTEVVIGEVRESSGSASGGSTNPFAPPPMFGKKRGG